MRSRLPVVVSITLATVGLIALSLAKDPPPQKERIKEGVYYGFRGHIYDRSTIAQNFTLYWSQGSQPIEVSPETKIFRKGQKARLQDVKSGDAVDGIGRAQKGKLIAVAVAFGDDGVRLPDDAKPPGVSLLPLAKIEHGRGR